MLVLLPKQGLRAMLESLALFTGTNLLACRHLLKAEDAVSPGLGALSLDSFSHYTDNAALSTVLFTEFILGRTTL